MSGLETLPMLAVDTSGPALRMAIGFGEDRMVTYEEKLVISHGRVMLKKIDDLMHSSGLAGRDLRSLTVSVGPGSFTGLRIGLSMAKGLATALDLVMVSVSAFELAAYKLAERPNPVTVLVPFKKDACFSVTVSGGEWIDRSVAAVAYRDLRATTDGEDLVALDEGVVTRARGSGVEREIELIPLAAADLIHLGRQKLRRADVADIDTLEPLYLQKSQAEIRFDQRQRP